MFAAAIAATAAWAQPVWCLGPRGELRFGLTAVVVRENLNTFGRLAEYLSLRLGRPVEFVQRRTYAEIMILLSSGELDVAWICGYPFVRPRSPEYLALLATPVYLGAPLYRSLVIVPMASDVESVDDLRGKVFAYSDPDSNSGYLVPRTMLTDMGYDPDEFYRFTFFTFSHAETVMAVAEQVADGGAVDSYVYDMMRKFAPDVAARTRVVRRSPQYGFPPIVARTDLPPAVRERLQAELLGMSQDAEGADLLRLMNLDGFARSSPALYDPIRELARRTGPGRVIMGVDGG